MRLDIAFFLCCCRSFLSSSGRDEEGESFYDLLGVSLNASPDELKRAYKRQSLQMHPDKLAQKGRTVTPADRDRFTRMRHAYEVLSDPRRRETYDAIGERGMKWVEEPLSVDPQELAHNFATSSIVDRSKIFAIFLSIYVAVFLLPVLVCLMADGTLGPGARWVAVLTPLWVWDVFILFYHVRVMLMGPIKRPDHIPEVEWVDPLPMQKRIMATVRFACLACFQVLLALRLDGYVSFPWYVVFCPMYFWEAIALRRKVALAGMSVVTSEELELAIGKKMAECTAAERDHVHRRYIVVPSKSGPIYESARRLRDEAKMDIVRILARVIFTVLLVLNLDMMGGDWSWWLVFIPIFAMALCIVISAFRGFSRSQAEAARRDPAMFGLDPGIAGNDNDEEKDGAAGSASSSSTPYTKMNENKKEEEEEPLTDEEREELKSKVAQSAYRTMGTFLSQCFFIIILCVLIAKIQGAGYPSLVIISPFLAAGGIVLCCLACTIFCIAEVDENAGMAGFDAAVDQAAKAASGGLPSGNDQKYTPPTHEKQEGVCATESDAGTTGTSSSSKSKPPPKSTWDPERGEIWQNTTVEEEDTEKDSTEETQEIELKTNPNKEKDRPATVKEIPSIPSVTSSECDLD